MTREQLLPPEILEALPTFEELEKLGDTDPVARVKFFFPDFSWTWYVVAFDGEDTFYGLVNGFDDELGDFRLSELLEGRGEWGLEVERDLYFTPTPVSELMR